jgi:hypothetical protein
VHRCARFDSSHALLARHKRALAFRQVDNGLSIARCHCGIRLRNLVCRQPHVLNINGPTPLLEFEVKPPAGQSVASLADVQPELDTDRNEMPGYWHTASPEDPGVRAGYVELYFRTSQRLFALKFRGQVDRIFRLKLPANPIRAKYRAWSDWQNPDFVAKSGEQPSRPSGGNDYQIRYKMDYQDR